MIMQVTNLKYYNSLQLPQTITKPACFCFAGLEDALEIWIEIQLSPNYVTYNICLINNIIVCYHLNHTMSWKTGPQTSHQCDCFG